MQRYLARVGKYVPHPDERVVRKLVAHCGIALRRRDASRVAIRDRDELARIRDGFCVKRLGLSPAEAESAIAAVCRQMSGSTAKCRVAFYYLLAETTGQLERFCSPAPGPTSPSQESTTAGNESGGSASDDSSENSAGVEPLPDETVHDEPVQVESLQVAPLDDIPQDDQLMQNDQLL